MSQGSASNGAMDWATIPVDSDGTRVIAGFSANWEVMTEHLTEQGVMDAARLCESPFTDVSPAGPEALFSGTQVNEIVEVLRDVRAKAA